MAIEQWRIEHLTCHVIDKHQVDQINLSIQEKKEYPRDSSQVIEV